MATTTSPCSPNNKNKSRDINWTQDESQILVDFVRAQRACELFGSSGRGERAPHNIVSIKRGIWEQAAQTLLEAGGPKRHWLKIRKKWGELASKARKYRRETEKTGGGEKPKADPILEQVLDVLAPASKDGVIPRGKGESFPQLENGHERPQLLNSPRSPAQDDGEGDEDDDDDEGDAELQDGDDQPEGGSGMGGPSSPLSKPPSAQRRPVLGSVVQIENARLQVEQDRLHLEREHLETIRNIHSSLVDLNTNMQMLLAVVCNHQGVTLVSDEN